MAKGSSPAVVRARRINETICRFLLLATTFRELVGLRSSVTVRKMIV